MATFLGFEYLKMSFALSDIYYTYKLGATSECWFRSFISQDDFKKAFKTIYVALQMQGPKLTVNQIVTWAIGSCEKLSDLLIMCLEGIIIFKQGILEYKPLPGSGKIIPPSPLRLYWERSCTHNVMLGCASFSSSSSILVPIQ